MRRAMEGRKWKRRVRYGREAKEEKVIWEKKS